MFDAGKLGRTSVFLGIAAAALMGVVAAEPLEIGAAPQFFVDDEVVDNRWELKGGSITRHFHAPVKDTANPLIAGVGGYVSVRRDPDSGLFQMWYQDFWLQSPKPDLKYTYGIAYAESVDGLAWTLPKLGLHEFRGTTDNNIVWLGTNGDRAASPWLLELPDEAASGGYRYVMQYKGTDGVRLVGSQDGVHWDPASDRRIAAFHPDTLNTIAHDPALGKYVMYTRATDRYTDAGERYLSGATRRVARMESGDLWGTWEVATRNIMIPDERDAEEGFTHFYGMPVRHYAGIYWGCLWPFRMNDLIVTDLAFSRDGYNFTRLPGRPRLIDVGPEGAWDCGMVFGSPCWVEAGDEWWIYYAGYDGPHSSMERTPSIGLARVRKEGFVSLRAPANGGVVSTRLIRWPGGELVVNAAVMEGGSLVVRVTDAKRETVPGYSYEECEAFTGDSTRHPVKWVGLSLDELKGTDIRLEFMLKAADLYTFRADVSVTNAVMPRRDSRQFALAYEANEMPPEAVPPWTQILLGAGWMTNITDGVLTVETPKKDKSVYWKLEDSWTNQVSYAEGFTVEIRYKVDSVLDGINYAFYLRMGDMEGNNTGDIYFSTNRIDCNKFTPALNNVGGDNTGTFHTLRIAKEPNSPFFCIWKDSVFIGRGRNAELVPGYAPLMFGDWSSRSGGVFAIDYIRWDLNGAYAPEKSPTGTVATAR